MELVEPIRDNITLAYISITKEELDAVYVSLNL
jgi:hypothetical protein